MRIVWLCHYFAPEMGAPQARLLEMSRAWLASGHEVGAVTCFPNHPTGELCDEDRGRWSRHDDVDGVSVHRCWSFVTPNKGFVKKLLGHLSFMFTGYRGLSRARKEGRPDVVIVSSPTFFAVLTAYVWCAPRRIPWVFEVRDLWPAVFVELGVLKNRLVIGILEAVEMFLYRRATAVVAVTQSFVEDIARRGIAKAKLGVIYNGVDLGRYEPRPPDEELARAEGLDGKFVVLYLGAHGISHALARIVDAAERLRDLDDVRVVFVGEGAEKEQLRIYAAERGLDNVIFHDGVPKDDVARWYSIASVALVPLRNVEIFKTFIPSKMFELMAAGLPIVASVEGEAREILDRSGGARVVAPEDSEAIAREIRVLHADPELRARMAAEGRTFVSGQFTRTQLAARYEEIIRTQVLGVAQGGGTS